MFPFQFDLSRLSYGIVVDAIAPIFPGGVIALGWLLGNDSVWNTLHDERAIKVIVAGFAIYVIGYVVLYLTAFEVVIVAAVIAALLKRAPVNEPWKNKEWRKIAVHFVGSDLCPPIEEPPTEPADKPLPVTNVDKFSSALREQFARALAPIDFASRWSVWYGILQSYFPANKNAQQEALGYSYLAIFHAIGWAGLVAAYAYHKHVGGLFWLVCALVIAIGHGFFTLNLYAQHNPDVSGNQLAAEILKAIKARESSPRL